ncbi:LuxR C-terminal-related transcriptional regulator [Pseudomonas sp. 18.1.10]|uniref:LuxR C-terminal-related transcriptional regulator n=1 Tax=Pseudomonas sp. 18.1.10 TaxID=2969302 RepID=UPI00214FE6C5|nr:LuxR C-terminal-related transcriptional regulator [Pseudomonas sp. 18.1.10]MCR4536818.1 LuxR C-terminal-related transcriptional regulator [Pseudomonas sp. 18.1.10]
MNQKSPPRSSNAWYWIGKLTPPQLLLTSVAREALLNSMQANTLVPLTLLTSPAGYGKTTLLMQWHAAIHQQAPKVLVAWLSVDEADADPNRFLAYLILALDHAGVALAHLPRLAASQALDVQPQRTIQALLRALAEEDRSITLFLDDYHLAASPEVGALLGVLVEQAAPWLRWVVASRTRPDWPLSRWKAKGWVHEISARELILSLREVRAILGEAVDEHDVCRVHIATEGWAVAVQLAHLWRTSIDGTSYGLTAFSGGVTEVANYLTAHIFNSLSADCQSLLLQTSLLQRFNADLTDAVRGRHDSADLLRQLHHLDTLLIPLDPERQWFRYHALLRDFLRLRIDSHQAQVIHRAAAHWLAQQRDWSQAIHHALKAGDIPLAVNLVVSAGGWELVLHHGIRYAQGLLSQFDAVTCNTQPDLLLLQAYLHAKLGDHKLSAQLLHLARCSVIGDARLTRDFHVIQTLADAYQDCFERLDTDIATFHSSPYPLDQTLAQATLECVHALAALTRGEWVSSLRIISDAHVKMRVIASPRGENYCRIHEAQALAVSGSINEASTLVDEALAFADNHFGQESSLRALVGCFKARQLYWQGTWSETQPWLDDGWAALEHADGWLDVVAVTAEVAWRTRLRSHGLHAALQELDHVDQLARARQWPRLSRLVQAWSIDAQVQSGQLHAARQALLQANLQQIADQREDWRSQEAASLALGRLQLLSGCSGAALTGLQRTAEDMENKGLRLPAWRLRLMALAAASKGQRLQSEELDVALAPIIQYALPGLLLEVGPCLLPALEAYSQPTMRLTATITRLRGWRSHPTPVQMSLSGKETQVLELLASGQSNKAIALALDISENTVKFHLKHLFAKLGVDNRTAAISAAIRQGHLNTTV